MVDAPLTAVDVTWRFGGSSGFKYTASTGVELRVGRGVGDRLLGVLIAMLRNRTLYKPLATTTV